MNVPPGRNGAGARVGEAHAKDCDCWSCVLSDADGPKCKRKALCLAYDGHPGRCYGVRRVLVDSLRELLRVLE